MIKVSKKQKPARLTIDLNGIWDFIPDAKNLGENQSWFVSFPEKGSRRATIPMTFQTSFPELREFSGYTWFSKKFYVPKHCESFNAFLKFGSVNYDPKIWVNGLLIGSYEGGYHRICAKIEKYLHFGASNTLTVKTFFPPERILGYYPHGKQKWYGHAGGLWQKVELSLIPMDGIQDADISTNFDRREVAISLDLPKVHSSSSLEVKILKGSRTITSKKFRLHQGIRGEVKMKIPGAYLWSPEEPNLYEAVIALRRSDTSIDKITRSFGFRKVEAKHGKVYLNGKPLLIRGALSQCFYPGTHYTPPSEDYIRNEIQSAKKMGFNLIRLHVKIEDELYLAQADKLGILIWEDVPNLEIARPDNLKSLETIFEDSLRRDRGHPSAIIWCIANEAWGVDPSNSTHKDWLIRMYNLGKRLCPNSLIIDNSPCAPNFHVKTDIADFHCYLDIPTGYKRWDEFIKVLSSKKSKGLLFGNNSPRGKEPLFVSEFGVWGLPDIKKYSGSHAPWWIEQGWGPGIPKGVVERFKSWSLDSIWNESGLARATQLHEFLSLKYLIEGIRKNSLIAGYVVTQLYDLHWECNGLLTFNRQPKVHSKRIMNLNYDELLFVDRVNTRFNVWEKDKFIAPVLFSKWSEGSNQGEIHWNFAGKFGKEIVTCRDYRTSKLANLELNAPIVKRARKFPFKISANFGKQTSTNEIAILVASKRLGNVPAEISRRVVIADDLSKSNFGRTLQEMGCLFSTTIPRTDDILVTGEPNEVLIEHLANNGCALLNIQRPGNVDIGGRIFSVEARGEEDIGFHIVMKREIFRPLPIENPMGWVYCDVLSNLVIRNLLESDRRRMGAGYFEGWVNATGATILFSETGTLILTTLNFGRYGVDPASTIIFNNLLKHLYGVQLERTQVPMSEKQ